MSRARELAKAGGVQQRIAGFSSHVGMSTFLAAVHMENNLTVDGNASVGGNLTVTGTTTFNGGTLTLGDANTDNIVFGGEVDSNIVPDDDNSFDLGSSSKEWKDLYVDGTAHIDTLDVDENAGIIGNLTLTGNGDFNGDLDVDGTTNLDVVDIDGAVDMATTLTLGGNADFNGDLDVDGTTNLDVVDIDGAVDMASNLVIAGNIDANGNLDVDGTTDLDTTNVVGTLTVTGDIAADNVTINGNTLSTSSGNLTVDSSGGTVTVSDNLTVSGTVTLNTSLADSNLSTISTAGKVDIGALEIDGATDIGADLVDADLLIVDDGAGGTERKSTFTRVKKYIYSAASGDATASDSGAITLANSGVSAGTVGSSTAIPIITVDAKGRITNTSTTAVDSTTIENGSASVAVASNGPITSTGNHDFTAGIDVTGNSTFANNVTITGNAVVNGDVDLGNATSDTITATGRFDSDIVPSTDNARDLGASGLEFKDLYLDGTANIDSLVADTADINAGTIDNTVIGGSTAAAGSFTTISATGDVTLTDTTADSAAGPELLLYRNSASPADGDYLGTIKFQGESDTGATRNYAKITGKINDASNGSEDGIIEFTHLKAGSNNISGRWNSTTLQLINGTDFSVAGDSTFTGDVTVTGAVDANGGASIDNVQIGVSNDNEIDTSTGNLVIDSAGGTTTIDDNLTVSGNLTVNGTTTTINSTTVAIDDKNFQVATGAADDSAADGAGLTVDSGDGDKTWNFEATGDNWGASENINIASGKSYKINNTAVLNATTLGSSVVASSLTSVGTIATGVWQGTAIANGYLANSTVSYGGVSLALGASDGTPAFDLSDATNYPTSSLSGTITNAQLAGSIAASKLAGSIGDSKLSTISTANKVSLSALNIDGGTDIGAALVDADEIIVDDGGGGTNRRCDLSRVKTYIYAATSGDATASSAGAITLANSGVTAGSYGSATAIPAITVDAKGRITALSTNTVNTTTNLGSSTATDEITITSSTGNNVTIAEASGSIAGLMSVAHHDKLDGIEASATADQTASEILTLIKTVDGAGSGLDADTLDGISSASFLRSDTSDTFSGTLTVSGNILPNANGTRDLGASGTRWANVYSSDLDLSNQAKGANSVDGTWGSYLIEEGEDHLFLTNRRSGKKFRFVLEEV